MIGSSLSQLFSSWGLWVSLLVFFASLLIMPLVIISLPENYFLRTKRLTRHEDQASTTLRRTLLILTKNILGVLLLLAGMVMLVLPGQGVLTMIVGLMLMNFPGKYRLQRWLVSQRSIADSINWIRQRANKPPLQLPKPGQT